MARTLSQDESHMNCAIRRVIGFCLLTDTDTNLLARFLPQDVKHFKLLNFAIKRDCDTFVEV